MSEMVARRSTTWHRVYAWAALGALFAFAQFYAYVAWIRSEDFRPVELGADPIPESVKATIDHYQWVSVLLLIPVAIWFIYGIVKSRRIDAVRLMMIGWLSAYWLDPWLDFLRPMFTYNAYAVNFGCWCRFIPFWQSPHARIAEPVLIDAPSYFYTFTGTAVVALWAMRAVRQRWPRAGNVGLTLAGFAAIWMTMGLLDIAASRFMGFDAWPGAFQRVSFWGGHYYQFPVYEFLLFPSAFVASAFLLMSVDNNGYTAIERGVDRLECHSAVRTALRVLAFVAFCNVLNLAYTTAMGVHAVYADPWPTDMPSWLANNR
ncbi:spirocyclase AveC family protein [Paraburkholderia sp. CNPSo 3281]|uniref:spirocyclase AveC family protein n=1 Tax=Paraburkholderia sp. CNPSo 3281 TaxID=2940933 RepID=UPI0020B69446|nr:spirocyclase AveC family protein [Paraburkholderia sp. CNPSo 3281]MCP3715372.1 spirocyclase AveC family protein [Paraburkholderia sp. CNPSo 3281]